MRWIGNMKNPLNKRFIRELKEDWSKYLVIFLLMTGMIGLVSGFIVADESMIKLIMKVLKSIRLKMVTLM